MDFCMNDKRCNEAIGNKVFQPVFNEEYHLETAYIEKLISWIGLCNTHFTKFEYSEGSRFMHRENGNAARADTIHLPFCGSLYRLCVFLHGNGLRAPCVHRLLRACSRGPCDGHTSPISLNQL